MVSVASVQWAEMAFEKIPDGDGELARHGGHRNVTVALAQSEFPAPLV